MKRYRKLAMATDEEMAQVVDMVQRLAEVDEEIGQVLAEHVSDLGELLPYLAIGDYAQWAERVVGRKPQLVQKLIDALAIEFARGVYRIEEAISVSFLEYTFDIVPIRLMLTGALAEEAERIGPPISDLTG